MKKKIFISTIFTKKLTLDSATGRFSFAINLHFVSRFINMNKSETIVKSTLS